MGRDPNEAASRYVTKSPTGPHVPPAQWQDGKTPADIRAELIDRLRGMPGRPHLAETANGFMYVPDSLTQLAKGYTIEALATQIYLMTQARSEQVQGENAERVLSRGWGKVAGGDVNVAVQVNNVNADAAWAAQQPTVVLAAGLDHPELLAAYRSAQTPAEAVAALQALLTADRGALPGGDAQ